MENAKCRYSCSLSPLLRRYRRFLTLLHLPPYRPKLNPIKQVWKLAYSLATQDRCFVTLDGIVGAVTEEPDRRRRPITPCFGDYAE